MTTMKPVEPAPPAAAGHELCPHCARWVRVRRGDGNMVAHPRTRPRCRGTGDRSTVPHVVTTPSVHYHVTGRLNAEIIARTLRAGGDGTAVEILAEF